MKKYKYELWVGIYEHCTNYQVHFVSSKLIWFSIDKLEKFLKTQFNNFSKITFIAQEANPYISCKDIHYKKYENFVKENF